MKKKGRYVVEAAYLVPVICILFFSHCMPTIMLYAHILRWNAVLKEATRTGELMNKFAKMWNRN